MKVSINPVRAHDFLVPGHVLTVDDAELLVRILDAILTDKPQELDLDKLEQMRLSNLHLALQLGLHRREGADAPR